MVAGMNRKAMAGVPGWYLKARGAENETWGAGRVPESIAWGKGWLARIGMPEYLPEDSDIYIYI